MLPLVLQVRHDDFVVFLPFLVVTFQNGSRICSFLHLIDLNGYLRIFGPLLLFYFRVVDQRRSDDCFEPRVACVFIIVGSFLDHAHGESLVCLLEVGHFRADVGDFVGEVQLNFVSFFGIIFHQLAVEHDQLGEVLLGFEFLECFLLPQQLVDELLFKCFGIFASSRRRPIDACLAFLFHITKLMMDKSL